MTKMPKEELDKLTITELQEIVADAYDQINKHKKDEIAKIRKEFDAKLNKSGFKIQQIYPRIGYKRPPKKRAKKTGANSGTNL